MAVLINVRRPFHHDRAQIRCIRFALILSLVAERVSPPSSVLLARVYFSYFNVADTSRGTGRGQGKGVSWGWGGVLSGLIHISRRVLIPRTLFYFHVEFAAPLAAHVCCVFIRTRKDASQVITEERSNNNTCVSFASAPASSGWCAKSF